jgi:hypothetical protein
MQLDRRTVLQSAGIGTLAFLVDGREVLLTPKEARAADFQFRGLTKAVNAATRQAHEAQG